MKTVLAIVAIFILIGTNPSLEQHRSRIRAAATEQAERELGDGIGGSLAKFVGVADMTGAFVAAGVGRVNLFVCSFGKYDGKIVSFGALGCVIVL